MDCISIYITKTINSALKDKTIKNVNIKILLIANCVFNIKFQYSSRLSAFNWFIYKSFNFYLFIFL